MPDEVVRHAESDYLKGLYRRLIQSDEFAGTIVKINSIPKSAKGEEFVDQFLGSVNSLPVNANFHFKKARIMIHWANKIGADVSLTANGDEG